MNAKSVVGFIILIIFISGCSGLQTKRGVENNIFYSSSNPHLSLKVSDQLHYIGKVAMQHPEQKNHSFIKECYVFLDSVSKNKFTRGVLVEISSSYKSYFFLPELFSGMKNKIESGDTTINGKNYEQAIAVYQDKFDDYINKFISSKGYHIPECMLLKGLGRRIGKDGNTKVYIIYFEDINEHEDVKNFCEDINTIKYRTDNQQQYLRDFNDRFARDIQIMTPNEFLSAQKAEE